jgi:flagellar hook-basal body complex protein FliE
MNPISSTNLNPAALANLANPAVANRAGPSFTDVLLQGLEQVNAMQQDADQAVQALFTGGDVNAAEVLTAVQKADMSFQLMMQMRNKLVQAYQEIKELRI